MNVSGLIQNNKRIKRLLHYLMIPKGQARPRRWVSWLVNPFIHKRGAGARICRSVRLDVLPFRHFELGERSTVEDFCTLNNGVGDIIVGSFSRVGIGSVVIGPVTVGNQVIIAQHVVISGLNHTYESVDLPIRQQPVVSQPVIIEDECWIGSNAVITAGVRVGKHSVIAAGSIVTKNVPAYTVVAGNPARVIKYYDREHRVWVKSKASSVDQRIQFPN